MFLEMFSLNVKTLKREQFISITDDINALIQKSGAKIGSCKLFVPHTTAAITINENADPDVIRDLFTIMDELIPHQRRFLHSEGNSDSHFKSSFFGVSLEVPIEKGKLSLGQWQGIYFCEFDGPRMRRVKVQIFGKE
jgi:secondary thiamine-phosphate synthase enzyme